MTRRLLLALVCAMVCSTASLAACGGDRGAADTERPLTRDEWSLLAGTHFQNHDRGGASFQLAVQVGEGATINLQGRIDWREHVGYAQVSGRGVETGVREVYWSDDAVLEARDDLAPLLAQAGVAAGPWVVREPDPEGRQLDQALALVTGLASEQRDNPQVLQQQAESAFLRDDTLRDVDVVVLRYDRLTYWLAADDGRMVRFESNNASGTRPTVFDVLSFDDVVIEGPPVAQVTDVAEIAEIYAAAVASD
jgi:hypothetical protein